MSPAKTYFMNALIASAITVGGYAVAVRMIAYLHGMPHPRLSPTDALTALFVPLVVAVGMAATSRIVYRTEDPAHRAAAFAATVGNLMATLFAASASVGDYGLHVVGLGMIVGIAGTIAALRSGLEEAVGGAPLLFGALIQLLAVTTLL